MTQQKNDELQHNFPAGLGQPAIRALGAAGYTSLEQLTAITEIDLLKLHGMGPKAIGVIRNALNTKGLSFAAPEIIIAKEKVFDSPTK